MNYFKLIIKQQKQAICFQEIDKKKIEPTISFPHGKCKLIQQTIF